MGKISFRTEVRFLTASLRQLRQEFQREMRQKTERVEQEALGMVALGLNVTVYGTAPGKYTRSQDLLRGAHTSSRVRPGVFEIEVWNDEPYTPYSTYGVKEEGVTPQQAETIAGGPGASSRPIATGRSGTEYEVPSLAHTRAAVFALFRLEQEARATLKKLW